MRPGRLELSRVTACAGIQSPAWLAAGRALKAASPLPHRQATRRTRAASFDHLVGAGGELRRHFKPESLGSFEIDHEFNSARLIDGQVGWLFAFQNPADIHCRAPKSVADVGSIAHKATLDGKFAGE